MFTRALRLPDPGTTTFFLWGPRQTGKTTLLRAAYPDALWVDLLRSDDYRRYLERPALLREELLAAPRTAQIVIDEIQKVPALLDEVHGLHESRKLRFALCGSSARKVRRGAANLLGGRARRFELFGLTAGEIGRSFDLVRLLNHGYLPSLYESDEVEAWQASYVGDYLREEVAAEGLVRNLQVFSGFLRAAALSDGELVNFASIARDCGVSSHTVKEHFHILEDTLLGRWLPAYTRRPKRRVVGAPKFYFSDVGVVNHLAHRGRMVPGGELFGKAFENWVLHELCAARAYQGRFEEISYWRLASGIEVDFVVGEMNAAIEAKSSGRITSDHLKGLRALKEDQPGLRRRVVVCLEPRRRRTEDGIEIWPAAVFAREVGELLETPAAR